MPTEPKPIDADAYLASGHTLKDAQACLADFKKQGREDKIAYYTALVAAIKKG